KTPFQRKRCCKPSMGLVTLSDDSPVTMVQPVSAGGSSWPARGTVTRGSPPVQAPAAAPPPAERASPDDFQSTASSAGCPADGGPMCQFLMSSGESLGK